jgi:hypothetical protein
MPKIMMCGVMLNPLVLISPPAGPSHCLPLTSDQLGFVSSAPPLSHCLPPFPKNLHGCISLSGPVVVLRHLILGVLSHPVVVCRDPLADGAVLLCASNKDGVDL